MRILFCIASLAFLFACGNENSYSPKSDWVAAPDTFQFVIKTNKGEILAEAIRDWSPEGVDRLYQLLGESYYDSSYIFRVQPPYVVQFGISGKPSVSQYWRKHPIHDEPLRHSNLKGTISYAREGKDSRDTQLFINLEDNFKLDTIEFMGLRGFPPVGRIIGEQSWNTLNLLNGRYGFDPANHQEEMYSQGNEYFKSNYSDLDFILRAELQP
ncbi:MAG: peptidylprolyl isomerase [Bacteroidia bacterium]|nr:peptidylprolyl isomerase [Bacteroidia bacterium]